MYIVYAGQALYDVWFDFILIINIKQHAHEILKKKETGLTGEFSLGFSSIFALIKIQFSFH